MDIVHSYFHKNPLMDVDKFLWKFNSTATDIFYCKKTKSFTIEYYSSLKKVWNNYNIRDKI